MPYFFIHGVGIYASEHLSIWTPRVDGHHVPTGGPFVYLDRERGRLCAQGFSVGNHRGEFFELPVIHRYVVGLTSVKDGRHLQLG